MVKLKFKQWGRRRKAALTSFFSCVYRVNNMEQKLMLIVLIYLFYYRSGFCFSQYSHWKKSVKSLHCKRLNTSHRRGDISTPKLNRFNCTCIVLLLQVKAVPTFTLVLTREQCPAWLLFKYKTIKTTIDDFTHNIIHYIRNTSKLISIKVSRWSLRPSSCADQTLQHLPALLPVSVEQSVPPPCRDNFPFYALCFVEIPLSGWVFGSSFRLKGAIWFSLSSSNIFPPEQRVCKKVFNCHSAWRGRVKCGRNRGGNDAQSCCAGTSSLLCPSPAAWTTGVCSKARGSLMSTPVPCTPPAPAALGSAFASALECQPLKSVTEVILHWAQQAICHWIHFCQDFSPALYLGSW